MEKIIKELEHYDERFPRAALEEAIKRQDEITPILLDILEDIVANTENFVEKESYMLHLFGMYLLAQFREKRAFPKIIDLISLPPEDVESLLGDTMTGGLSSILFSTYDGQFHLLQRVIEDPAVNEYVRGAALYTLGKLYSEGEFSKDYFIEYLRKLIDADCDDWDTDLATQIQKVIIDHHIFEMIDDVQCLYDEGRIEIYMYGTYDDFIDSIFSYEFEPSSPRYIDDTIAEMHWWACFKDKQEEEKKLSEKGLDKVIRSLARSQRAPKKKKIGRNEPCPCGSGKKYKHCCLKKPITPNKINESEMEKIKWLKDYPVEGGTGKEGQVYLSDFYDQESIEIDKLVYLALHHRAIPLWEPRDYSQEKEERIIYLTQAAELFEEKCFKEGIGSFEEYDADYKIHYRSEDWFRAFEELLTENGLDGDILEKVRNTIAAFS